MKSFKTAICYWLDILTDTNDPYLFQFVLLTSFRQSSLISDRTTLSYSCLHDQNIVLLIKSHGSDP